MEGPNIIHDDNGNPCIFTTTIHNPLDITLKNKQAGIVELYHPNPQFNNMNDKTDSHGSVLFREKSKYFVHLNKIFKERKKEIYLIT